MRTVYLANVGNGLTHGKGMAAVVGDSSKVQSGATRFEALGRLVMNNAEFGADMIRFTGNEDDGLIAYLEEDPELHASGASREEAVGQFARFHHERLGFALEDDVERLLDEAKADRPPPPRAIDN